MPTFAEKLADFALAHNTGDADAMAKAEPHIRAAWDELPPKSRTLLALAAGELIAERDRALRRAQGRA